MPDPEVAPDEWKVENIFGHRQRNGKWEFLVKLEGFAENEAVWEPVNSFFHRYNAKMIDYAEKNGICLDATKFLSKVPMTA